MNANDVPKQENIFANIESAEPLHFLIIDDKKVYINIIKNTIKENRKFVDDTFTEAINGREALVLMAETIPDIIITDYQMPEMNGLQFIKSVRSIERLKNVPIIMVTSVGEKDEILRVMEYGLAGYILKPATENKIWGSIYNCIHSIYEKRNAKRTESLL